VTGSDTGAGCGAVALPHPLLADAFAALDAAGIAWCVLRGEPTLADPTGDVDLLVDAGRLPDLDDALAGTAFHPDPGWNDGDHRHYVGRRAATERAVHLDVESAVTFGPSGFFLVNWLRSTLRTGAAAGCLARRRRCHGVAVLHPDDAFWCLLLHCVVDVQAVPARYRTRLRDLAEHAVPDGALGSVVTANSPPGWTAERVREAAREQRWAELVDVGAQLRRRSTAHRPLVARASALRRGLGRVAATAARKVVGRR
jgi:hypothetical protein